MRSSSIFWMSPTPFFPMTDFFHPKLYTQIPHFCAWEENHGKESAHTQIQRIFHLIFHSNTISVRMYGFLDFSILGVILWYHEFRIWLLSKGAMSHIICRDCAMRPLETVISSYTHVWLVCLHSNSALRCWLCALLLGLRCSPSSGKGLCPFAFTLSRVLCFEHRDVCVFVIND